MSYYRPNYNQNGRHNSNTTNNNNNNNKNYSYDDYSESEYEEYPERGYNADEFASLLSGLRNTTRAIQNITDYCAEYIDFATPISEDIKRHILKTNPDYKLAGFYLIDYLVKTIDQPYTALFSKDLLKLFADTYGVVNDNVRKKLIDLFIIWENPSAPRFPSNVLVRLRKCIISVTNNPDIIDETKEGISSQVLVRDLKAHNKCITERDKDLDLFKQHPLAEFFIGEDWEKFEKVKTDNYALTAEINGIFDQMEGLGISTTIDQGQRNTSLFNEQAEEIFDQVMKVKKEQDRQSIQWKTFKQEIGLLLFERKQEYEKQKIKKARKNVGIRYLKNNYHEIDPNPVGSFFLNVLDDSDEFKEAVKKFGKPIKFTDEDLLFVHEEDQVDNYEPGSDTGESNALIAFQNEPSSNSLGLAIDFGIFNETDDPGIEDNIPAGSSEDNNRELALVRGDGNTETAVAQENMSKVGELQSSYNSSKQNQSELLDTLELLERFKNKYQVKDSSNEKLLTSSREQVQQPRDNEYGQQLLQLQNINGEGNTSTETNTKRLDSSSIISTLEEIRNKYLTPASNNGKIDETERSPVDNGTQSVNTSSISNVNDGMMVDESQEEPVVRTEKQGENTIRNSSPSIAHTLNASQTIATHSTTPKSAPIQSTTNFEDQHQKPIPSTTRRPSFSYMEKDGNAKHQQLVRTSETLNQQTFEDSTSTTLLPPRQPQPQSLLVRKHPDQQQQKSPQLRSPNEPFVPLHSTTTGSTIAPGNSEHLSISTQQEPRPWSPVPPTISQSQSDQNKQLKVNVSLDITSHNNNPISNNSPQSSVDVLNEMTTNKNSPSLALEGPTNTEVSTTSSSTTKKLRISDYKQQKSLSPTIRVPSLAKEKSISSPTEQATSRPLLDSTRHSHSYGGLAIPRRKSSLKRPSDSNISSSKPSKLVRFE